jgi:hypothetical protein
VGGWHQGLALHILLVAASRTLDYQYTSLWYTKTSVRAVYPPSLPLLAFAPVQHSADTSRGVSQSLRAQQRAATSGTTKREGEREGGRVTGAPPSSAAVPPRSRWQ